MKRSPLARSPFTFLLVCAVPAAVLAAGVPDFCFLHTSDNHVSPQPVGAAPLKPGDRAYDGLAWIAAEAGKPQVVAPLNLTTPPPAFVIDTGDLTEYGVIHKTWDTFEAIVKPMPVPLYITPGNHDNTWTGSMHVMRARHGSDHYAFDKFGCHFVCLDSATPQEPLPSIEKRTLEWLAADLRRVDRDTPVFLFCHHPLSTTEFASRLEPLRLLELIERHNVVLLMMGHGHGHRYERWNSLDSVMGGTTSHPVDNIGYNIVFVKDGVLRVAFRYRDPAKPMEMTLEKPLSARDAPEIQILSPKPATLNAAPAEVAEPQLPVRVQIQGRKPDRVTASLDDAEKKAVELSPARNGAFEGRLPLADAVAGMHFVRVVAEYGKDKFDAAGEFLFTPPGTPEAPRVVLKAGVKASPLATGQGFLVATTAGEVVRVESGSPRPRLTRLCDAGLEILHAPALAADCLYVSAAESGVHCVTTEGKPVWKCDVGAVVYGTPAVGADQVYVADMQGAVHAIDRQTGKLAWSKRHATYSIEMPVLLHQEVVYFGSWDGQVYAVNTKDGSLKWSKPGPAGHAKEAKFKSRYYAPADCMPLVVGDRLFVTDRAYRLGSYALADGSYLGDIASDVAAIGPTADGNGFYARGLSKGVSRYDAQGKPVWSQADVAMGRFPVAPVEAAGKVFACSNLGTLRMLDAATGSLLGSYQVTPELHVMGAVGVNSDGTACVAGMDGSVTQVRLEAGNAMQPSSPKARPNRPGRRSGRG